MSNHLASSSSPYLLQHAHQPVDWYPWGDEALEKAKKEDKLIIISVGYSTCHWCHVMAHETFDDDSAAAFMNEHFVSIKVDREERPDIDQVYMRAVQMMTGQGGWPLNVVALPDGRPIWGGTYFPKDRWIASLERILEVRKDDPESVEDYAQKLQEGVQLSSTIAPTEDSPAIDEELFHVMRHNWSRRWDTLEGGPNKAPKFPLPNNYAYLLRYGFQYQDHEALLQVERTLDAMAKGGIYDHVGGGFTRYSTDAQWRVPHFEKMLYDNGQLLELYANGFRMWNKESYADIILQTAEFLKREMRSENGLYYSALDADTEGEEGKFYVWTNDEMNRILGSEAEEFKAVASWDDRAKWEGENHVILKASNSIEHPKWSHWMKLLFAEREKREKPGVDTKQLSSWNALLISGLTHSALALNNAELKTQAITLGTSFHQSFVDGRKIWHAFGEDGGYIDGFCDDYALTIKAYIDLHTLTADEVWLDRAEALLIEALALFNDPNSPLLWYNSNSSESLISRSHETDDNVIPSSNAVMATNLFRLGRARGNADWEERSIEMTQIALSQAERYPEGFTQWAQTALDIHGPFKEVVVAGPKAVSVVSEIGQTYLPNIILLGITKDSEKSPFENRFADFGTRIFVCEQRACQLPVEKVDEAIKLINP
ncbi:thioredoxin domain-containing protein [Phaeocystidibacter luteus]|nr:thioredoxin domain-containing protein [Phaeocystidibacter luteus]